MSEGFFKAFGGDIGRSKLASTELVFPSATLGFKGDFVKFLRLNTEDDLSIPVQFNIRSELAVLNAQVSQGAIGPLNVLGATNATPIAITTLQPHGFVTGAMVTVSNVFGNVGANGAFPIIVTGPNSFTMTGSVGTGTYTGSGVVMGSNPVSSNTGAATIGGPLVGRLRWGVGSAYQLLDFDIPMARTTPLSPTNPNNQPVDDSGNGMSFCVTGSSFELSIRNDANLGPILNPSTAIGTVSPARCLASMSPGVGSNAVKLLRSIYLVMNGANLAPATSVGCTIPYFAKSVTFLRFPIDSIPLGVVSLTNYGFGIRNYSVPAGTEGNFPIIGAEQTLIVTNNGAVGCTALLAVFDVTPD
jgi:hypothetical protein